MISRVATIAVAVIAATLPVGAAAECDSLAKQFDWNAREIASEAFPFSGTTAEKLSRQQLVATKQQTIVTAMAAEKCPTPDFDLSKAYGASAYDCRASMRPLSAACDMKRWVPKR